MRKSWRRSHAQWEKRRILADDVGALFVAAEQRARGGACAQPARIHCLARRSEPVGGDWNIAPDVGLTIIPIPKLYAGGGPSAHDPGMAAMRPRPFAIFSPDDAARLGFAPGDIVRLTGSGGDIDVEAKVGPQAPAGVALVLADMPEAPVNRLLDASGFGLPSCQRRRATVGDAAHDARAVPEWVLTVAIKSGVLIFIVVTSFAYLMLTERKMLGWFQLRARAHVVRTLGSHAAGGGCGQVGFQRRPHAGRGGSLHL